MRILDLISLSLLSAALCAGRTESSPAQGGWRQWEVRLRDGRRLEANPLGAPDDGHLSLSVGAYEGSGPRIARALVSAVAVLPMPDSLNNVSIVPSCEDAIVRRDGTTTVGRITLARVRWSEGVVSQRGRTVDLRDVAYLVFATRGNASANCRGEVSRHQPDMGYPIGMLQVPTWCADDCRT